MKHVPIDGTFNNFIFFYQIKKTNCIKVNLKLDIYFFFIIEIRESIVIK